MCGSRTGRMERYFRLSNNNIVEAMIKRICLTALVLLVAACHAEQPEPAIFGIAEADAWTAPTRTLLTATDIGTRKTGITLAAYADGSLAAAGHYSTGLEAMPLDLEPE